MMIPIPSSSQGRFIPTAPSIQLPSPPAFHFNPKIFEPKIPTPPPFKPLDFTTFQPNFKDIKFDYRSLRPAPYVPSPMEEKVACVFLLTLVWGYTAAIVAAIAHEKGFAKRSEISMALIGATTVTILTYANIPMGLASIAIITLIGCFVCKSTISSPASRDLYEPRLTMNWPPNIRPLNFQPIIQAGDVARIMRAQYGPPNQLNAFRVEES